MGRLSSEGSFSCSDKVIRLKWIARATNFEMETSALYGLAGMLGHRVCTVCTVVANRLRKEYSKDHHAAIDRMIKEVLERATA